MYSKELLSGLAPGDIQRILAVEHSDPHSVLGAHPATIRGEHGLIVRAFHPDAKQAEIIIDNERIRMKPSEAAGLYWLFLSGRGFPLAYRVCFHFEDGTVWEADTPYRFTPTLGEQDLHYIGQGKHYELYEKLGAHPCELNGVKGTSFAVWAPNAKRVSVIGNFNRWDGRLYPMRSMGDSGVWELFVPGIGPGELYKYEIKTAAGELRIKTDPYAFSMQLRPGTASVVWDLNHYQWSDHGWMAEKRTRDPYSSPMSIYEVHLGSWLRISEQENRWASYREIAPALAAHVTKYGFTHVELMPIMEHPFDASWGYQVTGYFAPTSRFGTPDDFKFFVDTLHRNGIGVILDWVPAHFPRDDFSLRLFDGTPLYEHADPRLGEHKDWGTLIFNYGRHEVRNFLVSNALFWLDKYHIDGLRVDAVASLVYLDYSRAEGEWIPNVYGGNENLEAIEFIKEFNSMVYARFPGCFTVAEESTAWTGVTTPVYLGGLGFGFKWDMGWMHDTLEYFSKEPIHRSHHHNELTFSMMYAYSENFILPLSHDEVVYGKGSLLRKMPGDDWQKFANLRLLLAYMFTHPGKKLLMAGSELGTWNEWHHESSLELHLLQYQVHDEISRLMADLGKLYISDNSLWKWDHKHEGFSWIDCNDYLSSVLSYIRRGPDGYLVCVCNFTPVVRKDYRVGVPEPGMFREVINSDSEYYGGSNVGNGEIISTISGPQHGYDQYLNLVLPPLACIILRKM
ncbi:MAG TPA: 1,4-alpha-glucan branching protein GlgB [Desulfomonilaceae bacterium]|nr:1,4-alpha-glucan branching protein GlgB [Desulfomonilaceae bacterium]